MIVRLCHRTSGEANDVLTYVPGGQEFIFPLVDLVHTSFIFHCRSERLQVVLSLDGTSSPIKISVVLTISLTNFIIMRYTTENNASSFLIILLITEMTLWDKLKTRFSVEIPNITQKTQFDLFTFKQQTESSGYI